MEELFVIIWESVGSLLSLAWSVLPIIGMWLVFEKAGTAGWKAIIPFYNMYTMFKLGERKKYFVTYLIGSILYTISAFFVLIFAIVGFVMLILSPIDEALIAELASLTPIVIVSLIAIIAGAILNIFSLIKGYSGVCKKMGQGAGMVIGLLLLPPVFWMILGVNDKYQWETTQENQAYIIQEDAIE